MNHARVTQRYDGRMINAEGGIIDMLRMDVVDGVRLDVDDSSDVARIIADSLTAHGPHNVSIQPTHLGHVFFLDGGRSAPVDGFGSLAKGQGEEGITAEAYGGTAEDDKEDDEPRRYHRRNASLARSA